MKTCIECKHKYDENEGYKNPYWCPECDKKRIRRIDEQLQTLISNFKEKERTVK